MRKDTKPEHLVTSIGFGRVLGVGATGVRQLARQHHIEPAVVLPTGTRLFDIRDAHRLREAREARRDAAYPGEGVSE